MDAALLQCIICPGQPRFSDASHLLTHVSSKAHLSHYFKLQVRSHQDAQAVELLEAYDDWFNDNNLPQLLSDRISSKEDRKKKRKSGDNATVNHTDTNLQGTSREPSRANPVDPVPRARTSLPDFLDPRLVDADGNAKPDPGTEDASFSCYATPATSAAVDAHSTSVLDGETGFIQPTDSAKLEKWHEEDTPRPRETAKVALPVTPKRSRISNRPSDVSWVVGGETSDLFVDGRGRAGGLDDIDVDKERADEMARLKGVLWPGMDIFDAATQQMRRKRNQKKDGNVLKMMEMTSLLVEPTELIFSPTGIFRKQRVISGNVEDDSPLKGETPVPKRRVPRPRGPRPKRNVLRQNDPNLPRAQDRKSAKKMAKQSRNEAEEELFDNSPTSSHIFNALAGSRPSYMGEDDELNLSVQAFAKRPRSGFTIFADENDRDKQSLEDQRASSKLPRDTLTPARLVLDRKSDTSNNHGCKTGQSSLDKENIEPILNPQNRMDLQSWSNSPFLKRNDPADARYASRYLFGVPSGAGLSPEDDSDKCAYRTNPLLAPSSRMDFYAGDQYDEDITVTASGWTAISRAVSSEATISEEEHNELARLYLANND